MSNIDKRALREAAEKATKGEWAVEFDDEIYSSDGVNHEQIAMVFSENEARDAAFIAAANPATVLALLDELEPMALAHLNLNLLCDVYRSAYEEARHDGLVNWEAAASLAEESEELKRKLEAAEKRIAELEAKAFNPAILDVIAERQRQRSVEGWTSEHDDEHSDGEMALAASSYALYAHKKPIAPAIPYNWPWEPEWFKQQGARRDLVKAGALILAEIERIDRAAGIGKGE